MEEMKQILSTIIIDFYLKLKKEQPGILDIEARKEIASVLIEKLKVDLVDNCGTNDEKNELIDDIFRKVEDTFA